MATADHKSRPLDPASTQRLAGEGLDYRLVDTDDESTYGPWQRAVARGFLGPHTSDADAKLSRDAMAYRRTTGVYDASAPDPLSPVGTVNSWIGDLSVPGGAILPSWAVSCVTVAPTHMRRGVARQLLEGELRTAADAGVPMAMLTVSESQLYGRYGFGCAVNVSHWSIDAKRANFVGPVPAGRVDFIPVEEWRASAPAIHDRIRPHRPGEVDVWPLRWAQMAGLEWKDGEDAKKKRAVRYTDEAGETRGLLLYSIAENHEHFEDSTLAVEYMLAETPDAYAALWRYALQHPLVRTVTGYMLSSDEPLRWMLDDIRSATVTVADHQYLRVLDVVASLNARTYADGVPPLALEVTDPLDFATGIYLLQDGTATRVETIPDGVAALRLGVLELGAIYLGGVSASSITRAGRITELTPGAATAADAVFASAELPYLSVWY